jgi:ferredoxin
MYHDGVVPAMSYSSYLAKVNDENCIDCGTCVDICSLNVIEVEDAIAVIDEDKCIGCGL